VNAQPQPAKVFTFPQRQVAPAAAAPAPAPKAEPEQAQADDVVPLDLSESDEAGEGDELLLDSDDILTTPVGAPPIAPPSDEEVAADNAQKPQPNAGGTLFERMQNIARGAAKAQVEESEQLPAVRREPIDIPRFLNRQNNQ
jgi:cell division protein FtsZ